MPESPRSDEISPLERPFKVYFYKDLEAVVPDGLLRALLIYRVLRAAYRHRRAAPHRDEVIDGLAKLMKISKKTVERCLKVGEGIFWRTSRRGFLVLEKSEALCKRFRVQRDEYRSLAVRKKVLFGGKGGFDEFYKIVHAIRVARVILKKGTAFIAREEMARELGISVSTLQRRNKDNQWVRVVAGVVECEEEPVVRTDSGVVFLRSEPEKHPSQRLWEGKEGLYRVRQGPNGYSVHNDIMQFGPRPYLRWDVLINAYRVIVPSDDHIPLCQDPPIAWLREWAKRNRRR